MSGPPRRGAVAAPRAPAALRVFVAPRLPLRAASMDQAASPLAGGAQVRAGGASYRARGLYCGSRSRRGAARSADSTDRSDAARLDTGAGRGCASDNAWHGAGQCGHAGCRTGRPLALRQPAPADGVSWAGAIRAFQRRQHQTRRPHQGRQQRGPPTADRGGLDLPLPSPGQPRVAAPPRRAAEADPRDRLEGHSSDCARAIASSPAPASPPMPSPPRSPASWQALFGPSPRTCRRRRADRSTRAR